MTLDEAIENSGSHVVYTHPATGAKEKGVISHVSHSSRGLVYVHYGEHTKPLATHPANLALDRRRR